MNDQLSGPMLAPKNGKAKRLMVLLHGYGSDGNDLIGLARYWQSALPEMLFVAPNAPEKCPMNPNGYQWFDLDLNREISRLNGSKKARPVLEKFLDQLWEQTGFDASNTFLVGFSQGAMMALDVGLRLKQQPLGIISFSGGLIGEDEWESDIKIKPPVCLVHGEADDVVPVSLSINSKTRLEKIDIKTAMQIEPGLGHTISVEGLGFALAFMRELLLEPQVDGP
ncbi:Phospholipase/carboxylesterase family protein [hydrothermal vent metagenome]|uniref:Phospholipase/carboxylesterase family protein n=1 Tax=hydrothermal vent metagenome TaxID=652676 RepID=A0A3B0TZM4_9ZZZZ